MTNQSKHHMQGGLQMANGRNQSELYQTITDICLDNGGVTKPMADRLFAYITANYTPNGEVEKQVREAELTFVARSADYYKQWKSELTKGANQ